MITKAQSGNNVGVGGSFGGGLVVQVLKPVVVTPNEAEDLTQQLAIEKADPCYGTTISSELVLSEYYLDSVNNVITIPPWISSNNTHCPFTQYLLSTTDDIYSLGQSKWFPNAVQQNQDSSWKFTAVIESTDGIPYEQEEVYIFAEVNNVISLAGAIKITLKVYKDTKTFPNPCDGGSISTQHAYIEFGLPLQTTTAEEDGDAGIVNVTVDNSISIRTNNKECAIVMFVLTSTKPDLKTIPLEGEILKNSKFIKLTQIDNWSLYYPHCQSFFIHAINGGQLKGGTIEFYLCTCGNENIISFQPNVSTFFLKSQQETIQRISSVVLQSNFKVDGNLMKTTQCGISSLSLAQDSTGTPYTTSVSNQDIRFSPNYDLVFPVIQHYNQSNLFVFAQTKGNKRAYVQLNIFVSPCGYEVVTPNLPDGLSLTSPISSGRVTSRVFDINYLQSLFTSTISYELCPIESFVLQAQGNSQFYLISQIYVNSQTKIEIDSNSFYKAVEITLEIAITTIGGFVAKIPFTVNIVDKPKTINMAPNFIEPLQNITIIADKIAKFEYYSPQIYDAEYDKIKINVKIKRVTFQLKSEIISNLQKPLEQFNKSADEQSQQFEWIKAITYRNNFVLEVYMGLVLLQDVGNYQVLVQLTDDKTSQTRFQDFYITLKAIPTNEREIQHQTIVYHAQKSKEVIPNFQSQLKSLGGKGVQSQYSGALVSGSHSVLQEKTYLVIAGNTQPTQTEVRYQSSNSLETLPFSSSGPSQSLENYSSEIKSIAQQLQDSKIEFVGNDIVKSAKEFLGEFEGGGGGDSKNNGKGVDSIKGGDGFQSKKNGDGEGQQSKFGGGGKIGGSGDSIGKGKGKSGGDKGISGFELVDLAFSKSSIEKREYEQQKSQEHYDDYEIGNEYEQNEQNEPIIKDLDFSRDGKIKITFGQKVIVPFIAILLIEEQKNRKLNSDNDLNIQKGFQDIFQISFQFDDQEYENEQNKFDYSVELIEWNSSGIQLFVNFTDPTYISQGKIRDQINLVIKTPIISQQTGKEFPIESLDISASIPRQLPNGVDEKEIVKVATSINKSIQTIVIINVIMQIFLKSVIKDLWGMFFTLQVCSYLTIIDVALPTNTEIYVSNFRKVVDFDFLKPNSLLSMINKNWSVEYFTNQVKESSITTEELITSNMASSGIESTNFWDNMNQYLIPMILAALSIFIPLLLMAIKPIRAYMKNKLSSVLGNYFFTGFINFQNISYIKALLVIGVRIMQNIDSGSMFLKGTNPLGYFCFIYPFLAIFILYHYRDRLDEPKVRDRIGQMYSQVHLKRHRFTIYLYPSFITRRLVFVMIPILFHGYPYFQVMFFLAFQVFFAAAYIWVNPHIKKVQFRVESLNDIIIIILSYNLLCFTNFILSTKFKFDLGAYFIMFFLVIIVINLIYMIINNVDGFMSGRRKKRFQKIYEYRFKQWQERNLQVKEDKKKWNKEQAEISQITEVKQKKKFYLYNKTEVTNIALNTDSGKIIIEDVFRSKLTKLHSKGEIQKCLELELKIQSQDKMRYDISLVLDEQIIDEKQTTLRLYALNVQYNNIISKNKLKKGRKLLKGKQTSSISADQFEHDVFLCAIDIQEKGFIKQLKAILGDNLQNFFKSVNKHKLLDELETLNHTRKFEVTENQEYVDKAIDQTQKVETTLVHKLLSNKGTSQIDEGESDFQENWIAIKPKEINMTPEYKKKYSQIDMLSKLGKALVSKVKTLEVQKETQLIQIETGDLSWQQYQLQKSIIIGKYNKQKKKLSNKQLETRIKQSKIMGR